MNYYLKKLEEIRKDPHQSEAYMSNNSTVVIAGPGSGKTTVLTLKIMRLLQEEIPLSRGLACVTYNRAAAKEFNDRLQLYGYNRRSNVFLGTVHSFCIAEVIKPFAHLFDYSIPMPLKIISQKEKKQIFNEVLSYLNISPKELSIDEMDKERSLSITGMSQVTIPRYDLALSAAAEYEDRLHSLGKVDYIDIVKYATLLIQNEKYVRNCLEAKFPWILVDEYQDLGKPLHEMILAIFNSTKIKIFAVGDPNQSIYSFNGAIPHYLLELYNIPNINPIKLLTNFRSNQEIIDAYQLALPPASIENYRAGTRIGEKAEFNFFVCQHGIEDQFKEVIRSVIPQCAGQGVPLDEICVLVANNYHAKRMSELFQEAGIPYHINKRKDFEISEIVKWLIQCASWSIKLGRESFSDAFEFWAGVIMQHKGYSILDNLTERKRFYDVLRKSRLHSHKLSDWLNSVEEQFNLSALLTNSDAYPDEMDNFKTLIELATSGEFSEFSVENFVKLLKPENQVTISTRHSSKGLEFEVVILLGLEEENFPSYRSLQSTDPNKLEEEFRMFFVCISRAKRACYLVRSLKESNPWGRVFNKNPSRFWTMLFDVYGE
ncbi:ATP-dependent DNA helicase PcrA [Paenibacillus polymyxa E681]|uniref:ATP-dependent helicase n=1 Tax=Paenibacillus polymyxa TaxID=1406 RepID=UPI0001E31AFE|nr:ATP-dependent helicase [Paenibacillus polymyxa]ADM71978.1 DNA helicase [Paenibacillus polymyxa E681]QNV59012.1 ATP-dependent DNA helicase PcrA [Paenibacillus polymyxa E681]QNV63838.1 ATP-dependent DNA helicase PcrA [Paenibacillus polymyxa E681]